MEISNSDCISYSIPCISHDSGTFTRIRIERTFYWDTTSGKVAGLGNGPTQVFLTTSGVTATTVCTNGGGHNPPGQNAFFGPTQGQITTIQPQNGQITFTNAAPLSITVTAAQAGCPGSMTPAITSAVFSNVVLYVVQGTTSLTFSFDTVRLP